jgi:putative membrane protein
MAAFLLRWTITTVAVFVATKIVPGVSDSGQWSALLGASLLLGIINAFVRPVLLLLSLPWIVFTMGIFILVLNALLFWFVSAVVPGFAVAGFWSALGGSVVVSLVSWPLNSLFRASDGSVRPISYHPQIKQAQGRTLR